MANFFEMIVQQLNEFGFYNFFFPFVISAVLLYALLRKTKLFGEMKEGQIISAIISLSVAFLVFGYPVLAGYAFGAQLSTFFTQLTVLGLLFVLALVFASMFYPDFPKMLSEKVSNPAFVYVFIGVAFILLVTSGLLGVFTQDVGEGPRPPRDVILIITGLIIFIVIIIIATVAASGGEKK